MNAIWWVMLGGSLGSGIRYLMGRLIPHTPGTGFPWHTFSVNLLGCFVIGLLAGYVDRRSGEDSLTRWLWMSGFCGGFTTFSAFSLESIQLLQHQRWAILLPYVLGSLLIGLLATWLGMQAIRHY